MGASHSKLHQHFETSSSSLQPHIINQKAELSRRGGCAPENSLQVVPVRIERGEWQRDQLPFRPSLKLFYFGNVSIALRIDHVALVFAVAVCPERDRFLAGEIGWRHGRWSGKEHGSRPHA